MSIIWEHERSSVERALDEAPEVTDRHVTLSDRVSALVRAYHYESREGARWRLAKATFHELLATPESDLPPKLRAAVAQYKATIAGMSKER